MMDISVKYEPPRLADVAELDDDQLDMVLHDLIDVHGYDFTSYSRPSLKRRIRRLMSVDRFLSFAEFRFRIRHDTTYLARFVDMVTVHVTEMFRDAAFYKALREQVLPALAQCPVLRVWHAGCSTGEEVYSMAILLHEAGLLQRSLLYATDINPRVLSNVRSGIFPLHQMKQYSENYFKAGGHGEFSRYYTAQYDVAKFDDRFGKRIICATHNLVSDRSFNEFQLILCRNVLIYFDKPLQDRVLALFDDSLEPNGYLALGTKETLKFSPGVKGYRQLHKQKIWQKP